MQVLLIGPVIYYYTKSLLNPSFRISKKEWLHLMPALLYLLYSLVIFITDKLILDEFYFYADYRDKDLKIWYQLLGFASISFYLIKSLQQYKLYKKVIFDTLSYADSVLFKWIQNFLLAFLALIILRILFFVFNEQWSEFGSHFWYFLSFAVVTFYVSLNGYENAIKSSIFNAEKIENPVFAQEEKNALNTIDIDFWKTKILYLLEVDKIYENPKLTLADVSKLLETNTKTISNTINSGFEMNFNDCINQYRIESVKEKLKNGAHKKSTLLGIAFDCGFNSKATFNRAFKKSTGVSPKDYLQKLA